MAPRERPALPEGTHCAVHSERLDRLEDGQAEILEALNGTLQAPGLLSQLALLRQSVEDLRRDLKTEREALQKEREGRALPNLTQVLSIVLAALLSVAGAIATMRLSAPPAPTAQTTSQGR